MKHDTLSDALSAINNAARDNKEYATAAPTSNLLKNVLVELQQQGYIGVFELVEDGKGGKFKIEVTDEVNECRPVKPNFSVQNDEFDKWAKRYLPAQGIGDLKATTSHGVMTHGEAREQNLGGKLLGYVY
ncbi:MAG: 30S ribosomal protein S8 [Candidatus Nanohaloarchaea archaeon]